MCTDSTIIRKCILVTAIALGAWPGIASGRAHGAREAEARNAEEAIPAPDPNPATTGPRTTPQHAVLAQAAGEWTARIEVHTPGQPTQVSKGTETATMTCGGMWLITHLEAEVLGAPYEGRGTYGYDPARGTFLGIWIDSTAPYPWLSEGVYDEAANTLTMQMEGPGPDGRMERWRTVTEYKDDGHRVFTMYQTQPDGNERPGLVIRYTRRR